MYYVDPWCQHWVHNTNAPEIKTGAHGRKHCTKRWDSFDTTLGMKNRVIMIAIARVHTRYMCMISRRSSCVLQYGRSHAINAKTSGPLVLKQPVIQVLGNKRVWYGHRATYNHGHHFKHQNRLENNMILLHTKWICACYNTCEEIANWNTLSSCLKTFALSLSQRMPTSGCPPPPKGTPTSLPEDLSTTRCPCEQQAPSVLSPQQDHCSGRWTQVLTEERLPKPIFKILVRKNRTIHSKSWSLKDEGVHPFLL